MSDTQQPTPSPEGLPEPPPILTLVLTTRLDGDTNVQYLGEPEWAAGVLEGMAQKIREDTARAKAAEDLL